MTGTKTDLIYVQNVSSMDAKLTLKLNKLVIDKAKAYASSHNKSLSRMIESYLKALTSKENPQPELSDLENPAPGPFPTTKQVYQNPPFMGLPAHRQMGNFAAEMEI